MFFKKKKLLNVKYKRTPASERLLDTQFSITDRDVFRVNLKNSTYHFTRSDDGNTFYISGSADSRGTLIEFGRPVKLVHADGTPLYFTLHEDFLYSIDYDYGTYVILAIFLHALFVLMIPSMDSGGSPKLKIEEAKLVTNRVNKFLAKKEELKKPKPVPTAAPTVELPKVVDVPTPKPEPVKPEPKQKMPKPQLERQLVEKPEPRKPEKNIKISNDKVPPKRLVVAVGPPKRGGTGPVNPNAAKDQAARSQAKKIAQTQAKVSNALGFLAKGKGLVNIPPGAAEGSNRFMGGRGLAGAKNVNGKNFLAQLSDKDVVGSSSGPINTTGSRSIATGPVVSDGEINGVANGKSLNYVQGKVSVSGLHSAGGSGSFGPAGSMNVSGNIDKDAVRRAIEKYMSKIRYCYERALLSKPSLSGSLKMEWKIQPGGRANGVRVVQSGLNDATLHSCVSGVIAIIPFPSPKGGPATVAYPFNFTSSSI